MFSNAFLHCIAQGQVTAKRIFQSGQQSNSSRDFMIVLVTAKFDEDLITNEGVGVFTTFPLQGNDC